MSSLEGPRSSRRKRSAARIIIENIKVDDTFTLAGDDGEAVGNGHYISTEINNKRYYGVLISQESLKHANDLHFQDEGFSLELNRRMEALRAREGVKDLEEKSHENKRKEFDNGKQVQKFKYVYPTKKTLGYRVILATYANVLEAAGEDEDLLKRMKAACDEGGNWVGKLYYQYEVQSRTLKSNVESPKQIGLHTSMSFNSFLFNTQMPQWYPLRNMGGSRAKVLSLLNLKTDKCGGAVKYNANSARLDASMTTTRRPHFRVGVLGAGLAGLGCAQELIRKAKSENMEIDVVLFEARDRVGGRCFTDYTSFKTPDGKAFPVEMGACWIHGVTGGNPLAVLGQAARVTMIKASANVKLLVGQMREAEEKIDNDVAKLFDEILDEGAQKCWDKDEFDLSDRKQMATRFYASFLRGKGVDMRKEIRSQYQTDVAPYRYSSDSSVFLSIQQALNKRRSALTQEQLNLLGWNIKHAEYSFGANIEDISMKFWDTDDEHAFKGPHVQLQEGYSTIAKVILNKCEESGPRFQLHLNCPVKKVEYGRKCFSRAYSNDDKKNIEISDTCRITFRDESKESVSCDFIVSALPLGVLKSNLKESPQQSAVDFEPPLPAVKVDSIEHMGFGMLNKVYLQFPSSFWRKRGETEDLKNSPYLADNDVNFGNASGVNPQHYMFFDVGFNLSNPDSPNNPCILHTLISGLDAVRSEKLSDEKVVTEVMDTLRHLFSEISIPNPVAFKISRWGSDSFSQGAYSFLPPGASDEDYHTLQSAVCADGDSIQLGDSKVMRLFFAGEHTSAHYPALAHGAYISGIRAARDIFTNMIHKGTSYNDVERVVPLVRFRKRHPKAPLVCSLCNRTSSPSSREGDLLVFQKDRRFALVHRKCVEHSPDVYYKSGSWRNVFKCINRGKQMRCVRCKKNGATIGCHEQSCRENFHFGCCDPSWSFEEKGKEYRCILHRKMNTEKQGFRVMTTHSSDSTTADQGHSDLTLSPSNDVGLLDNQSHAPLVSSSNRRYDENAQTETLGGQLSPEDGYRAIPVVQYRFKNPSASVVCGLCGRADKSDITGEFLAFDRDNKQALLHKNCLFSSNIIKVLTATKEIINVMELIDCARTCFACRDDGATLRCMHTSCFRHYHLSCAVNVACDTSNVSGFFCSEHIHHQSSGRPRKKLVLVESKQVVIKDRALDHNLFYSGAHKQDGSTSIKVKKRKREYAPSNYFTVPLIRGLEGSSSSNLQKQMQVHHMRSGHISSTENVNKPETRGSDDLAIRNTINQHQLEAPMNVISKASRSEGVVLHNKFKVLDPLRDIMEQSPGRNEKNAEEQSKPPNGHSVSANRRISGARMNLATHPKVTLSNTNDPTVDGSSSEKEEGSQINPIIVTIDSSDTDDDNPKLKHTGAATDPIPVDNDEDPLVDAANEMIWNC